MARKPHRNIPAEGLQFANHAELRTHFSRHHLWDLAGTSEEVKRVQGEVKELEEKATELGVKLDKHSKRLAAGRPPIECHMLLGIDEDTGKERTKLKKSLLNSASLNFKPAAFSIRSIMG